MNEISLLGKKIYMDKSPLLLKYSPDEDWQKYWQVMAGDWRMENGWLIGTENGNKGGNPFQPRKL